MPYSIHANALAIQTSKKIMPEVGQLNEILYNYGQSKA